VNLIGEKSTRKSLVPLAKYVAILLIINGEKLRKEKKSGIGGSKRR